MPQRFCISCLRLYDRDSAPGQRCPACQAAVDRQRNARAPTASRGYGARHQALRRQLVEQFQPGQPCVTCGQPMASADGADLGHGPGQRGYVGLQCQRCNRGAPSRARKGRR